MSNKLIVINLNNNPKWIREGTKTTTSNLHWRNINFMQWMNPHLSVYAFACLIDMCKIHSVLRCVLLQSTARIIPISNCFILVSFFLIKQGACWFVALPNLVYVLWFLFINLYNFFKRLAPIIWSFQIKTEFCTAHYVNQCYKKHK